VLIVKVCDAFTEIVTLNPKHDYFPLKMGDSEEKSPFEGG